MDYICSAYGSDSSAETDEEANKIPEKLSKSLTHVKTSNKLNNPILNTCQNVNSDIGDNVESNDRGKEMRTKQSFFGIDESDSDSNDEMTFGKDNISDSSEKCGSDLYKTHKCFEEKGVVTDKGNEPNIPSSAFWMGNDEKQEWQKPDKIWHVPNDHCPQTKRAGTKENNARIILKHSKSPKSYVTKKAKLEISIEREDLQRNENSKTLTNTVFFVHHKVAPLLHQKSNCRLPSNVPERTIKLDGHNGIVNRIRWGVPQFSHLLMSACMDRTVKIWNVFSILDKLVQTFGSHTKAVMDCQWTESGRQIITCSYDRTAKLFDVEKGQEIRSFDHGGFATCIAAHPVNPHFFIVGSLNHLVWWDQRCATKRVRQYGQKDTFGQVRDVIFTRDGSQFFTCTDFVARDSSDKNIMAWDFNRGVILSNQIYQERYTCTRLSLHPTEQQFMAQTQGDYIALFSTIRPYKMNKCKRFQNHKVAGNNIGCGWSPDGQYVVSGNADGCAVVYDYRTTKKQKTLSVSNRDVCTDVDWHPVLTSTVAGATSSGIVYVWH